MGKRSNKRTRNKKRGHRRGGRAKRLPVDEVITFGPLEMQRAGRLLLMRNTSSQDQHTAFMAGLAANHWVVVARIDELALSVAAAVARLEPLDLMMRAFYGRALSSNSAVAMAESDLPQDAIVDQFLLQSLQAVIVSIAPEARQTRATEEEWEELRACVREMYELFQVQYFLGSTAVRAQQPGYSDELDFLSTTAQMRWLFVRGERYQNHAADHLSDILSPQSPLIFDALGVTAQDVVGAFSSLSSALSSGPFDALAEMKQVHAELFADDSIMNIAQSNPDLEIGELLRLAMRDKGLEERMDAALARAFTDALFDVCRSTSLPPELCEGLALSPGQAQGAGGLYDGNEWKGWPLRLPPTWNKPFLKLNDRFYCFDLYALDRLHFVLERLVWSRAPDRKQEWLETRKAVTENVPVKLLGQLLPGAVVHTGVYYRWYPKDGATKKQWCECDVLLLFDDYCFVVEVKAGPYTYTSPADDFDAHMDSLRALLVEPTRQARRFVKYLESAEEVTVFDEAHAEIATIRRADFRRVLPCSVTWDQLTSVAANVQFHGTFRDAMKGSPVWCVSVDDLRVLHSVFKTPGEFTHYLEERLRAFDVDAMGAVHDVDEIDHLGMYLALNKYVDAFGEARRANRSEIQPHGYRAALDEYFAQQLIGENPEVPRQPLPPLYRQLLELLGASTKRGRSLAAHHLLDLAGDARRGCCEAVVSEIERVLAGGNPRLLTLAPCPISIAVHRAGGLDEHTRALLNELTAIRGLRSANNRQLLLYVGADDAACITSVDFVFAKLADLSPDRIEELRAMSEAQAQQDVARYLGVHRKIGRNDPCPCGSGKKYKKCCIGSA